MLTSKFIRAHHVNVSTTYANAPRWIFKLLYEFWGFCVNGSDDLLVPGGFASSGSVSGSATLLSGAVIFPAGFESGSTVLLLSGSDGSTDAGNPYFNTVSPVFSPSYVGKHLVLWKSGSTSTDDSVYEITKWLNSSSVQVNVNHGATPYTGTLHPTFTSRTQVNYRLIDFNAAANLSGYSTNDGLVLQFNGAYLINTGQLASQVRMKLDGTTVGMTTSPSGSWLPSSGAFVDPSTETVVDWASAFTTGYGYVSLWGAQDYVILHNRGDWTLNGNWFHVEIPARLYPQEYDPNLIVGLNYANNQLTMDDYWTMKMWSPLDSQTRDWQLFTRSPVGDNFDNNVFAGPYTLQAFNGGRYTNIFFNPYNNKFIFLDGVLGLTNVTQQFTLNRARVRRVRFTAPVIPSMQRLGDNGEWLFVNNGVLWPWDNAVTQGSILPVGA